MNPTEEFTLRNELSYFDTVMLGRHEIMAPLPKQKGHRTKPTPLGQYLTRWNAWFRSGLSGIELRGAFLPALEDGNARSVQQP